MKKIKSFLIVLLFFCLVLISCQKNYTRYYDDEQDSGLPIFSNRSNNIMACYIGGKPWRTIDRKISGFAYQLVQYEIYLTNQPGNGSADTLLIEWRGHFPENLQNQQSLTVHLPVSSNFSYSSLKNLQGQRIAIDGNNSFFTTTIDGLNINDKKGSGSIYFNTAFLDSIPPYSYSGNLSGIFEANFNFVQVTRGRFDHSLDPRQIRFYYYF